MTWTKFYNERTKCSLWLIPVWDSKLLTLFYNPTSPTMSFRSVDFPAPLGPTNAILVSRSKPKSRSLYIKGCNRKKRIITIQWKLVCQIKLYTLLHNQICTYYKQCSGCFPSIYNFSVGFWSCSDSVVFFLAFHFIIKFVFCVILEKHPIRTSYALNKAFWLDNIGVRVHNLCLKVLGLKAV